MKFDQECNKNYKLEMEFESHMCFPKIKRVIKNDSS